MKNLTFKTNIKCGGCVAQITPVLNNMKTISEWHVDTANPEKLLQVTAQDDATPNQIIEAIETAGFKAQLHS